WTVANALGGSDWQAMAIDAAGVARVAYIWSWGSGSYNGGFNYEAGQLAPNIFMPTSASCEMEFDSNGAVHIVAMLNLGEPIRHWWHTPTGWVNEDIGAGAWPTIAFDSQGRLHACYYQHPSHVLVHAVRNGDNDWTITPVDTDGDVGRDPSLAIDGAGRLNVSYYDATNKDLRFARSNDGGAAWDHVTVDSNGDVGKYSSLAVDGGNVHISYYQPVTTDSGHLRYARLTESLTGADDSPAVPAVVIRAVPNPFNPTTTLEYTVPVRSRVRVLVYDATGRVVATLVDTKREPGRYEVQYRARGASGVYFARIEAGTASATTKIVVLK
ncbi:MAG TPA: T9SS type A sorting domain-containing protein, partial [Candidatus Krumholzibacteria bacterium]